MKVWLKLIVNSSVYLSSLTSLNGFAMMMIKRKGFYVTDFLPLKGNSFSEYPAALNASENLADLVAIPGLKPPQDTTCLDGILQYWKSWVGNHQQLDGS